MKTRVTVGVVGILAVLLVGWEADWSDAADVPSVGAVDATTLGQMLVQLGVKPRAAGTRFDFELQSRQSEKEWGFAMSAVLSQDAGMTTHVLPTFGISEPTHRIRQSG